MITYLGAIVVASLLGSAHCVGMCGPMVLIATGIKEARSSKSERLFRSLGYHFGRLGTYLILGLAAGLLGYMILEFIWRRRVRQKYRQRRDLSSL